MSDILESIEKLPDVSFIDDISLDTLILDMINDYESKYEELTGREKTLAKSDPDRLMIYACAVQIYQSMQQIDRAGKQNLLKYSYDNFLDNLGALRSLNRNQAKFATVTVRFSLQEERASTVIIPIGTRVVVENVFFESTDIGQVLPGEISTEIKMTCTVSGEIGNGFIEGEIKTLADPIPYIVSVVNTTESDGGNETESNESFAERIYLSPSSLSTAGSEDAYIYWAKTYSQSVTDVIATSPSAGVVDIRFTWNNELPGEEAINGMKEFLSGKSLRPATDYVTTDAPEIVEYEIEVYYWIDKKDSAQAVSIAEKTEQAVETYIKWQDSKIGRDIDPSELVRLMREAGGKDINVVKPTYTETADISIAQHISKNVINGGIK